MPPVFDIHRAFDARRGGMRHGIVDITCSADYPGGGGWAVSAASLGNGMQDLQLLEVPNVRAGFLFEYDHVNGRLKVYNAGDGLEAAVNEAALDGVVLRGKYEGS